MSTGYILGIARGHNGGACLLKDGEIVFSIEEERLSRVKYDGGPYAAMIKAKEYTDKIDFLVVSHTQDLKNSAGKVDYSGDDVYTGLARKLGLIDKNLNPARTHPQVVDLSMHHHKIHAALAFYRSGFEDAAAVVVDGSGTATAANVNGESTVFWEVESIFDCAYPSYFKTLYKHLGTRSSVPTHVDFSASSQRLEEVGTHLEVLSSHAGIVKCYEAVTEYCGFSGIEAGKTMGLSPYGKENLDLPDFFDSQGRFNLSNNNLFVPGYPGGAVINVNEYEGLGFEIESDKEMTERQNRRDMAYKMQQESQEAVLDLILTASKLTGKKQIVLCGGYGLNCVANYHYLTQLNEEGIELYVEPMSNDGGTAIGVALLWYQVKNPEAEKKFTRSDNVYLGPEYAIDSEVISEVAEKYNANIKKADNKDIVKLMKDKNIVALWQGRSENGPRALGNRSLIFDPTFEDGKDYVNEIKRREYFRPFAGSILAEHVDEWFDLRGMKESPTMMYAVDCQPGVEEKIPSIIHVDGTCRIQTVTREQNPYYYDIISEFHKASGVPIVFNTSFNLGGEPLVETLDDALRTLSESDIEYLYLPEHGVLLTVKN
jgi:carbamoyltransferase